ncbi:conserved hypothetical protein [Neospora caninum Liverpool]|uniref:Uncharacterized protein n=1 Tax=Neospora caninum (strain Liverpool) TaxID=572307 RepID=F0VLG7_NEOCL|nr:conserved hypothetical protein [Neospora caninum Liverpool]CBZ54095.1 conserved hypothetical protein [Neospora caninum Liverpool]CEL68794.1 TPA: hypothetical protein BN1204_045280 [Neospora caninum Liverpool]|eukprot:XP_003884126.1 conserved hypothetical protein [Neospora caninum Liverpool]
MADVAAMPEAKCEMPAAQSPSSGVSDLLCSPPQLKSPSPRQLSSRFATTNIAHMSSPNRSRELVQGAAADHAPVGSSPCFSLRFEAAHMGNESQATLHGCRKNSSEFDIRRRPRAQQVRDRMQQRKQRQRGAEDKGASAGPGNSGFPTGGMLSAPAPQFLAVPGVNTPSRGASPKRAGACMPPRFREEEMSAGFYSFLAPSSPSDYEVEVARSASSSPARARLVGLPNEMVPPGLRTPPSFAEGNPVSHSSRTSPGDEAAAGAFPQNFQAFGRPYNCGMRQGGAVPGAPVFGGSPPGRAPQVVSHGASPSRAAPARNAGSAVPVTPVLRGLVTPPSFSPSTMYNRRTESAARAAGAAPSETPDKRREMGSGLGLQAGPETAPRLVFPDLQELYSALGLPCPLPERNTLETSTGSPAFRSTSFLSPNAAAPHAPTRSALHATVSAAGLGALFPGVHDPSHGAGPRDGSAGEREDGAATFLAALTEIGSDANGMRKGKHARAAALELFLRAAAAVATGKGGPEGDKVDGRDNARIPEGAYAQSPHLPTHGYVPRGPVGPTRPPRWWTAVEKPDGRTFQSQFQGGRAVAARGASSSRAPLFAEKRMNACVGSPARPRVCVNAVPSAPNGTEGFEAAGRGAAEEDPSKTAFGDTLRKGRQKSRDSSMLPSSEARDVASGPTGAHGRRAKGSSTICGRAANTPDVRRSGSRASMVSPDFVFSGGAARSMARVGSNSLFSNTSERSIASPSSSLASPTSRPGGAWAVCNGSSPGAKSTWSTSSDAGNTGCSISQSSWGSIASNAPSMSASIPAVGLPVGGSSPWSPASSRGGAEPQSTAPPLSAGLRRPSENAPQAGAFAPRPRKGLRLGDAAAAGSRPCAKTRSASSGTVPGGGGPKRSVSRLPRSKKAASVLPRRGHANESHGEKVEDGKCEASTGRERRSASCDADLLCLHAAANSARAARALGTGLLRPDGEAEGPVQGISSYHRARKNADHSVRKGKQEPVASSTTKKSSGQLKCVDVFPPPPAAAADAQAGPPLFQRPWGGTCFGDVISTLAQKGESGPRSGPTSLNSEIVNVTGGKSLTPGVPLMGQGVTGFRSSKDSSVGSLQQLMSPNEPGRSAGTVGGSDRGPPGEGAAGGSTQCQYTLPEITPAGSLPNAAAGTADGPPAGAAPGEQNDRGFLSGMESLPTLPALSLWGGNHGTDEAACRREEPRSQGVAGDAAAPGEFRGSGAAMLTGQGSAAPVPSVEWLVQQRKNQDSLLEQCRKHLQNPPQLWEGNLVAAAGFAGSSSLFSQSAGAPRQEASRVSSTSGSAGVSSPRPAQHASSRSADEGVQSAALRDTVHQTEFYNLMIKVANELALVSSQGSGVGAGARADASSTLLFAQGEAAAPGPHEAKAGAGPRPAPGFGPKPDDPLLERSAELPDYFLSVNRFGAGSLSDSGKPGAPTPFDSQNSLFFYGNKRANDPFAIHLGAPGLVGAPSLRMGADAAVSPNSRRSALEGSAGLSGVSDVRAGVDGHLETLSEEDPSQGLSGGVADGSGLPGSTRESVVAACFSAQRTRADARRGLSGADAAGALGEGDMDHLRGLVERWVGISDANGKQGTDAAAQSALRECTGASNLSFSGDVEYLCREGVLHSQQNAGVGLRECVNKDPFESETGFGAFSSGPGRYQPFLQAPQPGGVEVETAACSVPGQPRGPAGLQPATGEPTQRGVGFGSGAGNGAAPARVDQSLFSELNRCPDDIRELLLGHLAAAKAATSARDAGDGTPALVRASISLPYNLEKAQGGGCALPSWLMPPQVSEVSALTGLPPHVLQCFMAGAPTVGDVATPHGVESTEVPGQLPSSVSLPELFSAGSVSGPQAEALHAVVAKTKEMRWLQGLETFLEHQAKKGGGSAPEAMVAAFAAAGAVVGPLRGGPGSESGLQVRAAESEAAPARGGGRMGRVATVPADLDTCAASGASKGPGLNEDFSSMTNTLSWLRAGLGGANSDAGTGRRGTFSAATGKKNGAGEQSRPNKAGDDGAGGRPNPGEAGSGDGRAGISRCSSPKPNTSGNFQGAANNGPNAQPGSQSRRKAPRPSKRQRVLIRALAYVKQRLRVLEGEMAPLLTQTGLASVVQDQASAPASAAPVPNWGPNR